MGNAIGTNWHERGQALSKFDLESRVERSVAQGRPECTTDIGGRAWSIVRSVENEPRLQSSRA